jgi:hypothetical protein
MSDLHDSLAWAVTVSILGMLSCAEVNAQSSLYSRSSSSTTSSTSTSTSTSSYSPQITPFPFMMYSGNTSGLSPTDAAAIGTSGNQSGNMFNNPWASPFVYSGMLSMQPSTTSSQQGTTGTIYGGGLGGLATNQLGLMMMANQQMGGIGSGQLSGVRPGPNVQSRSRTGKPGDPQVRRSVSQPAGLAARYFSRTTISNPKPQVYYNRPSSYYPQVGH